MRVLMKIQAFPNYDVSTGKETPTLRISCSLHLQGLRITSDWSDREDGNGKLPKTPELFANRHGDLPQKTLIIRNSLQYVGVKNY